MRESKQATALWAMMVRRTMSSNRAKPAQPVSIQSFITTEHAKTAIEAIRLRWGKRWSKNIRVLIDRLRLSDLREACR